MIKKLRLKFICILMIIFTLMLCIVLGTVLTFTGISTERQSIAVLQYLASEPAQTYAPGDSQFPAPRIPYFILKVGDDNTLTTIIEGNYDLTDKEFLYEITETVSTSDQPMGKLEKYNLRYYKYQRPAPPNFESFSENAPTNNATANDSSADNITPPYPKVVDSSADDITHPYSETYIDSSASNFDQFIIFLDMSNEITMMHHLVLNCILIGMGGFVLFFFVSLWLSLWTIKPVENAWKQQRQFVADASHELKTPLTVILTNAELLQSDVYSEPEKVRFSENILTMSRQMRGLVESLLQLARADNGTVKQDFETLDFSRLVSNTLLPFEPLYFEQGLTLESEIEDAIKVKGCRQQLRQLVEILLDNAQKYSQAPEQRLQPLDSIQLPEDTNQLYENANELSDTVDIDNFHINKLDTAYTTSGACSQYLPVKITLKRLTHNSCQLAVSNFGPPLSSSDINNIFKRFWRMDPSRTSTDSHRSYGLGLSIAQSIVKTHKGRIWAESSNGINTFTVTLPMGKVYE